MPGFNLTTSTASGSKRGLNFITTKVDPVEASLAITINVGLIAAVVIAIAVWILCGYRYFLRLKSNSLNAQLDTLGQQVEAKMNQPINAQGEVMLEGGIPFEKKFIVTQQKLARYEQMVDDEKMIDLFPILSALTPEGMRLTELTIEPHQVNIDCFVMNGEALKTFANNIAQVNNATFQDGKRLNIDEVMVPEISMAMDDTGTGQRGLEMSVSFTYSIIDPPKGGYAAENVRLEEVIP